MKRDATAPRSAHSAAILAAAAAALGAWWWLVHSRPEVTTVNPRRGSAAEVVYATGNVEPKEWAKVVAMHRRRIVEICSCEGQRVKKGDVLARLDDIEERASLAELETRRETIKADAERLGQLLKRNVTTQVAYDEKLTQLREIDARIEAQKDRLYDLDLRAPMDGVVLKKSGSVGEIAGIGNDDVMFWVGEPKPLEIEAEVNEEDIAKVKVGQKVLLRHDGFPGMALDATVAHLTPKGDPERKIFSVTLALPDSTPLRIGMSVEANIVVREVADALLIPSEAIVKGSVITVVDGRTRRIQVPLGIKGSTMTEVLSGLDETSVVVSPADADLAEGTRVRIRGKPAT